MNRVIMPFLCGAIWVFLPHYAQCAKTNNYELFQTGLYALFPAADALLQLTPEQETMVAAAQVEAKNDPAVAVAYEAFKAHKGQATPEEDAAKRAWYKSKDDAQKKYLETVKALLNEQQLALLAKASTFLKDVYTQADKQFPRPKGPDAKGSDEFRSARAEGLVKIAEARLHENFTPDEIVRLKGASSPVSATAEHPAPAAPTEPQPSPTP